MTIVFVHGVPETQAIWDPIVRELGRGDVVRLSPPGFGSPVPDGFDPVRASYAAWLADELRKIEGPIDLVGHDWGAGHVAGVMATEPELVRSWAIDVAGIVHPDYVWHDTAQMWRTPDVGEQLVEGMMSPPTAEKAVLLETLGMPPDVATKVAEGNDETMGRCILSLYRSADPDELAKVWATLDEAARRPGMVIVATEDPYVGSIENQLAVAERAGATTTRLEGLGHWWMLQDPAASAEALTAFWSTL